MKIPPCRRKADLLTLNGLFVILPLLNSRKGITVVTNEEYLQTRFKEDRTTEDFPTIFLTQKEISALKAIKKTDLYTPKKTKEACDRLAFFGFVDSGTLNDKNGIPVYSIRERGINYLAYYHATIRLSTRSRLIDLIFLVVGAIIAFAVEHISDIIKLCKTIINSL